MRRLLFNPLTSLVLLALLLADTAMLPSSPWGGGVSRVGWFLREHVWRSGMPRAGPPAPSMYFLRDSGRPGELEVINIEDESADRIAALQHGPEQRPRDLLEIVYRPIMLRQGWWAVTTQKDVHELRMQFGENLTPAERATARRMFVERSGAGRWLSREDFETLAVEDINRTRPLVLGYVHNCVSAACAVLFLISLAWLPRAPGWVRAWRERRALSEGRCPGCGYSIAGLPAGVCPECGRAVPKPG